VNTECGSKNGWLGALLVSKRDNVRKVVSLIVEEIEMTSYRTAEIEGLCVFYREAGNPANPTRVLLDG
jgi:hypothetical protein